MTEDFRNVRSIQLLACSPVSALFRTINQSARDTVRHGVLSFHVVPFAIATRGTRIAPAATNHAKLLIEKELTMRWNQFWRSAIAAASLATVVTGHAQQPAATPGAAEDRVAAIKQSLQQGMAAIRRYQWVETTSISMKGEEKSRKQQTCLYGADGKVVKTPIGQPAPQQQASSGGRRGGRLKQQIVENKKDEMKDYMETAAALIHQYVPPNPEQIQAAKEAGRITVNPQSGGTVRLVISQYLKPSDSLTIDLDPAANRIVALGVNSYLDTKEDAVTLAVQMTTLPDGALYAAQTTLDAKAKNVRVVIQNAGHRPVK